MTTMASLKLYTNISNEHARKKTAAMNNAWHKAVMNKAWLKHVYDKYPSKTNWEIQRNLYTKLKRKSVRC